MLVWFFELLCVTLICTMYALFFFFLMYCEKSNYTCRFQTQNSILAKSFGTYLFVSMVTIEVLEGVHLFQDFSSFHEVSEDYVLNRKPSDIFQKTNKILQAVVLHGKAWRVIYNPTGQLTTDNLPVCFLSYDGLWRRQGIEYQQTH